MCVAVKTKSRNRYPQVIVGRRITFIVSPKVKRLVFIGKDYLVGHFCRGGEQIYFDVADVNVKYTADRALYFIEIEKKEGTA